MNAAIIVTYFPTEAVFNRLLQSLIGEVQKIYVVDNTPIFESRWLSEEWFDCSEFDVSYCSLEDNFGIAKAQNIGAKLACQEGYDHIIFFDQDSAAPKGMVERLIAVEDNLLINQIKVGSVGPLFQDEKTGEFAYGVRQGKLRINKFKIHEDDTLPVRVDYLISSGSLVRVSVLQEVGFMREDLFIDWVDIEWGLRAASIGYQHFIVATATMAHSIGDNFVSVGKRNINLHSDLRNYYIIRNASHLLFDRKFSWQWRVDIFLRIPMYIIIYSVYSLSGNRRGAFKRLVTAVWHGLRGKLGRAT